MENITEMTPLCEVFDFSKVPSSYVLCMNSGCPLRHECMRFFAGTNVPEDLETARCVMPGTLKDGQCRWFDQKRVVVNAFGFSHLYDRVLKQDFTQMRKNVTSYLHGAKMYYEYKRGDRPLSPEQQEGIRELVKSYGYTWEVPFDRYAEAYEFGTAPIAALQL